MNDKSSFYENVINCKDNQNDGGYLFVPQELIFELIGENLKNKKEGRTLRRDVAI